MALKFMGVQSKHGIKWNQVASYVDNIQANEIRIYYIWANHKWCKKVTRNSDTLNWLDDINQFHQIPR